MTAHLPQLHKSSQKITFYWIILQALSVSCNDFPKKGKPNSQIHILSQFSEGKPLRVLPGFLWSPPISAQPIGPFQIQLGTSQPLLQTFSSSKSHANGLSGTFPLMGLTFISETLMHRL